MSEYDTSRITKMTPATHTLLHSPREGRQRDGVRIFLSNTFSHLRGLTPLKVSSFEYIEVNFKHQSQWIAYLVNYRPSWSNINLFFHEFSALLDSIDMVSLKLFLLSVTSIYGWMIMKTVTQFPSMNYLNLISYQTK